MNSLHTKLKELRELRERASPSVWQSEVHSAGFYDYWHLGGPDYQKEVEDEYGLKPESLHHGDVEFIAAAANHWLTLIEALEKAVGALENIREFDAAVNPLSPKTMLQKDCEEALAEIAAMLEKD